METGEQNGQEHAERTVIGRRTIYYYLLVAMLISFFA
jgi:hypothetical protein